MLTLIGVLTGCGGKKSNNRNPSVVAEEINPLQVMMRSDCFNCHGIQDRMVGPPYFDISERYADAKSVNAQLAKKIREGGGGLWYGGVMSPHLFLKEYEIDAIVQWVLDLESNEKKFRKSLSNPLLEKEGNFSIYRVDSDGEKQLIGYVDQISFIEGGDIVKLAQGRTLYFKSEVDVDGDGKYVFRLQKSGKASLKVNGAEVVSERRNDQELPVELTSGSHTIEIFCEPGRSSEELVLSWIKPGSNFFELVR